MDLNLQQLGGRSAWAWLGLIASDYTAQDAAASLLEKAILQGVFPRGYYTARRALAIAASDVNAAIDYLDQSRETDSFCRALVLILSGEMAPARIELEAWSAATDEEAAIRGTLLTAALREDDPNGALNVALDTFRHTNGTAAGLQAATLLLARAARGDSASRNSDTQQAAELAVTVRNRRRVWGGDSAEAVEIAVAAALQAHDSERAWRLTQTPPDGEASEREATDERVRKHAALTAALRGDLDTARDLATAISEPFYQARVEALIAESEGNDADALDGWRAAWTAARNDAERLEAAGGIATSGGSLPDLADLASRYSDVVSEIRLVADVLAADDQMAALRANALRSRNVLIELAQRHTGSGNHRDAGDALHRGAVHWSDPDLMSMAAASYHRAGADDLARESAKEGLTLGGHAWPGRRAMLALLVEIESRSEEWPAAVTAARQLLETDPDDADAYWALARCQLAGADPDGAWATLTSAHILLTPRSSNEALVWLQLNARYSNDRHFLATALSIVRTWRENADLLGAFLALTYEGLRRDELAPTADELEELHEVSRQYWQQHPESTTFRAVSLGPDDDPLLPMAPELQQQYEQTQELRDKVVAGQLPLAMLASVAGRSFTEASLRRAAGVVYAVDYPTQGYESDIAHNALTTPTVIDPTVGHTLTLLDGPLRDQLLGSVSSVNTTDSLYRDALQAQDNLAMRSTLTVGWDPNQNRPVPTEISEAMADRLAEKSRQIAQILFAAARFPHHQLAHFPEDLDRRFWWLSGIDLAKTRGWAYWSDDRLMRQVASSIGVPAFGTVALLDRLAAEGRVNAMRVEVARAQLLRNFYVDLGFNSTVFNLAATEEQWRAGPIASALSRTTSWADADAAARFAVTAMGNVAATSPEDLAGWCHAAANGLTNIAGSGEAASTNLEVLLRQVATQPWFGPAALPFVLQGIRSAVRVSTQSSVRDPLATILTGFHGLIAKRSGHVTAAEFLMRLVSGCDEDDRALAARIILTANN